MNIDKVISIINKPLILLADMDQLRILVDEMQKGGLDVLFEEGIPYYTDGTYSCAIVCFNDVCKRLKVERLPIVW